MKKLWIIVCALAVLLSGAALGDEPTFGTKWEDATKKGGINYTSRSELEKNGVAGPFKVTEGILYAEGGLAIGNTGTPVMGFVPSLVLTVSGVVADGQTVTFDGVVFEFDPADDGVTSGNVGVYAESTSAADSIAALYTAFVGQSVGDPYCPTYTTSTFVLEKFEFAETPADVMTWSETMTNGAFTTTAGNLSTAAPVGTVVIDADNTTLFLAPAGVYADGLVPGEEELGNLWVCDFGLNESGIAGYLGPSWYATKLSPLFRLSDDESLFLPAGVADNEIILSENANDCVTPGVLAVEVNTDVLCLCNAGEWVKVTDLTSGCRSAG